MARLGLKVRLLGTIALVMVAVVALLTTLAIRRLGESLEREFVSKGEAVALALSKGMEQSQVTGISGIQDSVASDSRLPGVCYIYVVDDTGFVTAHAFVPTFPDGFEQVTRARPQEIVLPAQAKAYHRVDCPGAVCGEAQKGYKGLAAI